MGDTSVDPGHAREAADTFFALVSSDSYALLAGRLGCSVAAWRRWWVLILQREILGDKPVPPVL